MHMKRNVVAGQTAIEQASVDLWGSKQMGSTTQTLAYSA